MKKAKLKKQNEYEIWCNKCRGKKYDFYQNSFDQKWWIDSVLNKKFKLDNRENDGAIFVVKEEDEDTNPRYKEGCIEGAFDLILPKPEPSVNVRLNIIYKKNQCDCCDGIEYTINPDVIESYAEDAILGDNQERDKIFWDKVIKITPKNKLSRLD